MIISWVSVMYAEALNSSKSSVTLQRTDRHGILGQKPADFQVSLCLWQAERATYCPQDGGFQKQRASSPASHGAARPPSRVLVVGNGGRLSLVDAPGGGHALHVRSQARRGDGHAQRVFCACAPGDAGGGVAFGLTWGDADAGGGPCGDGGGLGARRGRCGRGARDEWGRGRNFLA